MRAWEGLAVPLVVAGDGELRDQVVDSTRRSASIRYEGRVPRERLFALMKQSKALVFPSEWYEGFPLLIAEAMACGVPVIAARLGAAASLVTEGETGLLFTAGDAGELSARIRWLESHPEDTVRMGGLARREYEAKYTADKNYDLLMAIYAHAARCSRD
jgi:glycosyltransferase involved in cell wall biosynthesis